MLRNAAFTALGRRLSLNATEANYNRVTCLALRLEPGVSSNSLNDVRLRRLSSRTGASPFQHNDEKRVDFEDLHKKGKNEKGPALDLAYKSFEKKMKEGEKRKSSLVIHHSLLGSKQNWQKVAKEINQLTRRSVVSVDARNHGESPHSADMSYSHMAKDVLRLVESQEMGKVSFMGHAMGGRIGMVLALTRPDLVDKLICVDATPKNTQTSLDRWRRLQEACKVLKAIEGQLRSEHGVSRRLLADKAITGIIPEAKDRAIFLTNLLVDPSLTTSVQDPRTRTEVVKASPLWRLNVDVILDNPSMMMTFPRFSQPFEGKCLFITGENSRFLRREDQEDIRKLFPNSKFAFIKGAGHWVQTEKHTEFLKHVIAFLEDKKFDEDKK